MNVLEPIMQYGFVLYIGMTIFFLGFSAIFLLVMHFLMPRAILDKYFNPPHFGEFERALYTGIPYAPMRTFMLMGVITFPSLGKKRNLTEVHRDAPRWYRVGSQLFIYQFFGIGGGALILLLLLVGVTFILDTMGLM